MKKPLMFAAVSAAVMLGSPLVSANEELNFDAYREMLADGNPAELFEMEGEELWRTARGPKNATLEQCDLGLGPGVVEGAAAQLPRYFEDTGKVQDLESRLLSCMETQQGIAPAEVVNGSFGKGERAKVAALVAYVVTHSKGKPIAVDLSHGRACLLLPHRRDGLCLLLLSQPGRQAHPRHATAQHHQARRRGGGLGLVACLPRVELAVLDHAAPPVGLLPPAAHGRAGVRVGRDDRAVGVHGWQGQRRRGPVARREALRRT